MGARALVENAKKTVNLRSYVVRQMPVLPQELLDQIIDHLQGDEEALRVCCLAHRSLLRRSQKYLFETVYIICEEDGSINDPELYSSGVAKFVKQLFLVQPPAPVDQDANEDEDEDEEKHRAVWNMVRRFTNLERLSLIDFDWDSPITPAERHIISDVFKGVTQLHLKQARFEHLGEFTSFLHAFPTLDRVELSEVFWEDTLHTPSFSTPLPTPRVLSFDGEMDARIVKEISEGWLAALPTHQEMEVEWASWSGFEALPGLFKVVGDSIAHLTLSINKGASMVDLANAGIHQCTALRSLTLFSLCSPTRDSNHAWVSHILSQVRSMALTEVEFRCHAREVTDVDAVSEDLRKLDALFDEERYFKALQRVSFSFAADDVDQFIQVVWGGLPKTKKRNLLYYDDRLPF